MRHLILFGMILFTGVCLGQNHLKMKFTGFNQEEGTLMVAVYEQDDFGAVPTYAKAVKIEHNPVEVAFDEIPDGEYAVMAFQDLNGDRRLNFDESGRPQEPYGISNNPVLQGPPSWEASKFELKSDKILKIEIK